VFWNYDPPEGHTASFNNLYTSIPFVLALTDGRAHGVFFDSTHRVEIDLAKDKDNCGACDFCLGELEAMPNAVELARKILSAVARVQQRFGAAHLVNVLRGRVTEMVTARGHQHLSVFGLLADALCESNCDRTSPVGAATPDPPVEVEVLIPWPRGDLVAMLYDEAEVLKAEAEPDGTRVRARVGLRELAAVRAYAVGAGGRSGTGEPIDQSV